MMAALIAITIDRNAHVSRMKAIAITARIRQTRRLLIFLVKSICPAVVPATYVVVCDFGSTVVRSVFTRVMVWPACGRVPGTTLNTAVVPAGLIAAGDTETTSLVAATFF